MSTLTPADEIVPERRRESKVHRLGRVAVHRRGGGRELHLEEVLAVGYGGSHGIRRVRDHLSEGCRFVHVATGGFGHLALDLRSLGVLDEAQDGFQVEAVGSVGFVVGGGGGCGG